jgi:hypothetical protein
MAAPTGARDSAQLASAGSQVRGAAAGAQRGDASATRAIADIGQSLPGRLTHLRGLRYTVRMDPALRQLAVELCFDGSPPARLVYGSRAAVPYLRNPHAIGVPPLAAPVPALAANYPAGATASPTLPVRDGFIALNGLAANGCIAFEVDVRAAVETDSLMLAYPGEDSLVLASESFLWRPERRSPELRSSVRFVLPAGVSVSTPWARSPQDATAFALDERAFSFTGHLLFGRFIERTVPAPGGQLRAAFVPGYSPAEVELLSAWLERAAKVASTPGGVFPTRDAQVIIAPTSPAMFPIHFGHTGRSGGASIVLFMPTGMDAAQLQGDWIAIHEFSHLWHPFIRRDDAWLSEGLATYLQEMLRVRAGLLDPARAWQRLRDGASLGRETARTLDEETRRMQFEHNYQRVYWAGAAIALMIDVQLREKTGGQLSLDALLARLDRTGPLFYRGVGARELLRALDDAAGLSVCERIASRYLDARMPDLDVLYRELGIATDTAQPNGDAPLAWVRDAIMTAPQPTVAGR